MPHQQEQTDVISFAAVADIKQFRKPEQKNVIASFTGAAMSRVTNALHNTTNTFVYDVALLFQIEC